MEKETAVGYRRTAHRTGFADGAGRVAYRHLADYCGFVMRRSRPLFRGSFGHRLRTITALVTFAQLLIVAAAPLAERVDSGVAPVHVEQAGTSSHHAHGDFCATCVALHLLWTPARAHEAVIGTSLSTGPRREQPNVRTRARLAVLLPRAPPA